MALYELTLEIDDTEEINEYSRWFLPDQIESRSREEEKLQRVDMPRETAIEKEMGSSFM